MHHIREGKHGARSTKQVIAIGLSKARRAGVNLRPPEKGEVSEETRRSAKHAYQAGQRHKPKASRRRSKATELALTREPRRQGKHFRARRAPRRESVHEPSARPRHAERREPKASEAVPTLLAKRRAPARVADKEPIFGGRAPAVRRERECDG